MPGHIDELIAYLSNEQSQDETHLRGLLTDVLQDLRAISGSDTFASEADRAVTALRDHNQSDYANAIETYTQNPSDETFINATKEIITIGARDVQAPELSDVAEIPTDANLSEGVSEALVGVAERIEAITPELISQKFDEALTNPEVQKELESRDMTVEDVMAQKDVLIARLGENLQSLAESLPSLQEKGMEAAREQIEQAVIDFPGMFDEAFESEMSAAMDRASQRLQDKFESASRETEEARRFLENGEMPTDPNSELVKKYDAAVINMADTMMQMRQADPKAFESMSEALSQQGEFGQNVVELVNQRIAEETATPTDTIQPGGMGQNR